MLDWLNMFGNYEQRVVANTKREDFIVDTAIVTDRDWIYETAVKHKDFNNGSWIVLDGCSNKEKAEQMHNKWLKFLDEENYNSLTDYYKEQTYFRNN